MELFRSADEGAGTRWWNDLSDESVIYSVRHGRKAVET